MTCYKCTYWHSEKTTLSKMNEAIVFMESIKIETQSKPAGTDTESLALVKHFDLLSKC